MILNGIYIHVSHALATLKNTLKKAYKAWNTCLTKLLNVCFKRIEGSKR
jgi:hypothetical protein